MLEDHRREGKRFIPPLMDLSGRDTMLFISYNDSILPELIWIEFLNEKFGLMGSINILRKAFETVSNVVQDTGGNVSAGNDSESGAGASAGNFAFVSSYDKLTGEEKAMLREKFEEEGILNIIRDATHPLAALYANYPLKFLGPSETASSKNDLVLAVKKCVGRVRNSHGPESAILRAFSLLFLLCAGRYKIFQGLEKPDIDSIIHDPSSEAAERAMSRIRGETLIFFQMSNVDPSWAKHFWNRNFELSPCEFESSSEERPR